MGKEEENKATKHIVNNFQGATIHNFVYNDHGTTNIYESVSHSREDDEQSQHFPLNRNEEEGRRWFEFLARRGFISNDTEIECWQYYMGFSAKRPDGLKPIVWLKTVETARMMIRKVHENLIEAGELKIVELEKLASLCFTKDGKPLKLSKPKKEISADADAIEKFLPTISDL